MTWNQIENKWAAMARRVRADWKGAVQDDASQPADERKNGLLDLKRGAVLVPDVQSPPNNTAMAE